MSAGPHFVEIGGGLGYDDPPVEPGAPPRAEGEVWRTRSPFGYEVAFTEAGGVLRWASSRKWVAEHPTRNGAALRLYVAHLRAVVAVEHAPELSGTDEQIAANVRAICSCGAGPAAPGQLHLAVCPFPLAWSLFEGWRQMREELRQARAKTYAALRATGIEP